MSTQSVHNVPAATSSPPRFYGLLKALAAFLATSMLIQGITAGKLLDGAENGLKIHETTSGIVVVALLITIVAAFLVRRGGGSARYLVTSLVVAAFTGLQIALGTNGDTAVYVPLCVALMGAGAALVSQVWSQGGTK